MLVPRFRLQCCKRNPPPNRWARTPPPPGRQHRAVAHVAPSPPPPVSLLPHAPRPHIMFPPFPLHPHPPPTHTPPTTHHGVWLLHELLCKEAERELAVLLGRLGQQVDVGVHGNLHVAVLLVVQRMLDAPRQPA